jgi:hypothetical protein
VFEGDKMHCVLGILLLITTVCLYSTMYISSLDYYRPRHSTFVIANVTHKQYFEDEDEDEGVVDFKRDVRAVFIHSGGRECQPLG